MHGGYFPPVDGRKNLIPGRKKGALGKDKRLLRHALILAAEKSRNSQSQDLEGYCIFLADERPDLFVALLGRLILIQAKYVPDDEDVTVVNFNMSLVELARAFEARIKDTQP